MIIDRYILDHHPGFKLQTLVHVGAHAAQEMAAYEALSPDTVIWVDAVDDHLKAFRKKRRALPPYRRKHHRYLVALIAAEDDADAAFHQYTNRGASSSLFRSTRALRQTWPTVRETGETTTLKTVTLDSLLARHGVAKTAVNGLVVDAQGSELLCLQGASAVLPHVRFLEVEVSKEAIYEGGVVFDDLDAWLTKRGFARRSDVPWHGDVIYENLALG